MSNTIDGVTYSTRRASYVRGCLIANTAPSALVGTFVWHRSTGVIVGTYLRTQTTDSGELVVHVLTSWGTPDWYSASTVVVGA